MTDPRISYPPQLPVSARKDEIAAAIHDNQVLILAGETGSGKTTQLPKICLEIGRGTNGLIGHTQPRRIAARSVADRIAHELGGKLGGLVGYQVRFTDKVSADTRVKLMTDGILLAEIQGDPLLRRYDTIIIDEAHERSLNIDFLLGYLARLLPKRPDLKVIITSATIDSDRFAQHFGQSGKPAPVIEVSGRTFPVEVVYRPLEDQDVPAGIVDACDELMEYGPGDILVFLAGERDIRDADQALREHLGRRYINPDQPLPKGVAPDSVEVLPLFARLSAQQQQRVFQPHNFRRIVLSTNVAETSLTVPGIRYVVDPGLARISRYSQKTKVQRLPIEAISQASAKQRSGRCGRVEDGVAIRLYSEEDFESRPEFTEPEILRTSLASVILQMSALGLGRVEDFPFVDPPDGRAIRTGVNQLTEIGAVKAKKDGLELTPIGRKLSRLPIDPRLGRMLLEGQKLRCATEVGVIVAALSIQDIRERPAEHQGAADEAHARFTDPTSDFITYLNLWRYVRVLARDLSGSQFRRTVRAEFLHYLRIREWQDVYSQLRQLAKPLGIKLGQLEIPTPRQVSEAAEAGGIVNAHARACVELTASAITADADAIHQALLVGLLSSLGNWSEQTKDYEGARGIHFTIWPGSGLKGTRSDWVMASELVETSRLFARTVAKVREDWIEPAAAHLIKRNYSEPYWSRRHGAAMVKEKVLLYGITLIADRSVTLGGLGKSVRLGDVTASELAREMFIRHALVEGDWRTFNKFWQRNQQALEDARAYEERTRQPGLVATEEERFAFYDERIPRGIVSAAHFDRWWKDESRRRPHLLDFTREFLLPQGQEADGFPDVWPYGHMKLPIDYQFIPGRAADGITVKIPLEVLPGIDPAGFEWLVPGLLPELITESIRGLPKPLRRQLVPAPQVAQELLPRIAPLGPFPYDPPMGSNPLDSAASSSVSVSVSAEAESAPSSTPQGATASGQQGSGSQKRDKQGTAPVSASSAKVDLLAASLERLRKSGIVTSDSGTTFKPTKPQPNAQKSAPKQQTQPGSKPSGAQVAARAGSSASALAESVQTGGPMSFQRAFCDAVAARIGQRPDTKDWQLAHSKLPDHLRPRFQVVASDGRIVGTGPDLLALKKKLAKQGTAAVRGAVKGALATALAEAKSRANQSANGERCAQEPPSADAKGKQSKGKTRGSKANQLPTSALEPALTWPSLGTDGDRLADSVRSTGASGFEVTGFPGLEKTDDLAANGIPLVRVHIAADPAVRDVLHEDGVIALVANALALSTERVTTRWNARQTLALATSQYKSTAAMVADLQLAAAASVTAKADVLDGAGVDGLDQVRDRPAFDRLVKAARPVFEDAVYDLATQAAAALAAYGQLDRQLRKVRSLALAGVSSAVRAHAEELVRDGFISRSGEHLQHLERYLRADLERLSAATDDVSRDSRLDWQLSQALSAYAEARERSEQLTGAKLIEKRQIMRDVAWQIEEYRVSLFAQKLGTASRVSLKRIRSTLSEI